MTPVANFIFCDQKGRRLLELPASADDKNPTVRIKRSELKAALRSGAPEVPIRYGMQATGYQPTSSGVEVRFSNGQTVSADYVVAADGVGSAVRQQLVGDSKRYLGLTSIVGSAPIALQHPLIDGGYFLMLGERGDSVFCYREAGGFHLSYTEHQPSEAVLAGQPADALLRRIQTATSSWNAPTPQIAAALDPASLVVRGYYDKEPLQRVRDERLWLLGDAAHPMSPFQGQGANMAMLDALKLAQLLARGAVSSDEFAALEKDIVSRGRKAVLESRSAAVQFHARSHFKQMNRNIGFRFANFFIKLVSRDGQGQAVASGKPLSE
jgi:2-polyprenyl-6-methoxyphenol hydroxylase-like FAD-dependent oxidoreductase